MLIVRLSDIYGNAIKESAKLNLRSESDRLFTFDVEGGSIEIAGLSDGPVQSYRMQVRAPSYHSVGGILAVPDNQHIVPVTLPMKASEAEPTLPTHWHLPESFQAAVACDVYSTLGKLEAAGLLNILTKLEEYHLLQHILKIRDFQQDRILAEVSGALHGVLTSSHQQNFRTVSGALHEAPKGFKPAGSYKSPEKFGNLQITLFRKGKQHLADIDIDDAAGFKHIFQVLRNSIKGPTHPYNIHQILVGYQNLPPRYTLHV